jgi:hypothetical protein
VDRLPSRPVGFKKSGSYEIVDRVFSNCMRMPRFSQFVKQIVGGNLDDVGINCGLIEQDFGNCPLRGSDSGLTRARVLGWAKSSRHYTTSNQAGRPR